MPDRSSPSCPENHSVRHSLPCSKRRTLNIATRRSELALWQANTIKNELQTLHPDLTVNLVPIVSRGDQLLDIPLAKVGGKGLFVKELENALFEERADIAVHSMKDVPVTLPEGLVLPVICEREDPRDALVSSSYRTIEQLPVGAKVGTSSLRRQCQLLALRPDLRIEFLRGNINTRLAKLDKGNYDAIILAAAGLIRLGWELRIGQYLEPAVSLPAGGQGALGIECRAGDQAILDLLHPLHHHHTARCVQAERTVNRLLNGGCQAPVASFAESVGHHVRVRALVGQPDGSRILRAEAVAADAEQAGTEAARSLLDQGAADILATLALPSAKTVDRDDM